MVDRCMACGSIVLKGRIICSMCEGFGGIMMKDIIVTDHQLNDMMHCIGFNKYKAKNKIYLVLRNFFATSDHDANWDNLILLGLATKRDFKHGAGANPQLYSVTKKGFKFLERNLDIRIINGL